MYEKCLLLADIITIIPISQVSVFGGEHDPTLAMKMDSDLDFPQRAEYKILVHGEADLNQALIPFHWIYEVPRQSPH